MHHLRPYLPFLCALLGLCLWMPTAVQAQDSTDCIYLPIVVNRGNSSAITGVVQRFLQRTGGSAPCGADPVANLPPTSITHANPAAGEGDVAVTRETILTFDQALDPATVTAASITARSGGTALAARRHLAPDRKQVTLFYADPLPDGVDIAIQINGDILKDIYGRAVDGDNDGTAGGQGSFTFRTLSLTTVAGTAVCGRVVASELDTSDSSTGVDRPLGGATITVDGAESTLRTTTNADGHFCLTPAPGNRFFVHIDGRTATVAVPSGAYYPFVGKAWDPVPGQQTDVGTIYLPLVQPGTLQAVSETEATTIHFTQAVLDEFPDLGTVMIEVPPDSLFADDGTRGGQVGIAPVPPDRLPGQLPGNLNFPVVITVQTNGATNFDVPAPICFPNLPDPVSGERLAAGAGSALISFNHDSGRWEPVGPMTVTADGSLICADEGVGVRAPGWHGAQAGNGLLAGGAGLGTCAGCAGAERDAQALGDDCLNNVNEMIQNEIGEAALSTLIPAIGCAIEVGRLLDWGSQCVSDGGPVCTVGRALFKGVIAAGTCAIPGAGGVLGLAGTVGECMLDASTAIETLANCDQAQCGTRAGIREAANFATSAVGFVPQSTNNELFNQQVELLDAYDGILNAIVGNPKWGDVAPAENAVLFTFYTALVERMEDGSSEGILISAAERTALLAQARPATINEADVNALLDRMNALAGGTLPTSETAAITAAAQQLETVGLALQAAGWRTIFDGPLNAADVIAETAGVAAITERLFYKIENLNSGAIIRGRLNGGGTMDTTIVAPLTLHEVSYVHPDTLATGKVRVLTGPRGGTTELAPTALRPSTEPDPDGDKLANDAEATLGTNPNQADSDGDGMNDGDEVQAGRDPLGFPIQIGDVISASIDTADEINRYTFTARGGQTIFLDTDGLAGFVGIWLTLVDSRGETLYENWIHWEPGVLTLEQGGTYQITAGDGDDEPHGYQLQVWDVPAPDEFTIAVGDVITESVQGPGAGTIETPGVKDIYTFTVGEGDKVQLVSLLPPGFTPIFWRIVDATGTSLDDGNIHEDSTVLTLTAGTYRLIVGNDQNDTTGGYHFRLDAVE